ncbi:desiccation-related protein PCC13-62 [Impatiens glandulifera]|uniref:desiccation-related protein PCC13-62 n=1 Tax=Impatiens glandulifera TaxID=253017 RepID=UPI001FB14D8B|nr:desiccation-related protein PCC13-62 [Impatiens glandulifera]
MRILSLLICFLFFFSPTSSQEETGVSNSDLDILEFPLNLEYLEAEFFLWGALGYGLDGVAPELAGGGPVPVGAQKAMLDSFTRDVILQFGYQEVGHLRAIKSTVKGFARPLLNLSAETFGEAMNSAVGKTLSPPFDPYANSINFLLASYVVPYVGMTGYVGANPKLETSIAKKLVAGLLAVESGQDAVIRTLLYRHSRSLVKPYGLTVAAITRRISRFRNKLGGAGVKDEGLIVSTIRGAERKTRGNVLAGDWNSLGFDRTPEEILRIVYGSGNESIPGGFYPNGGDGHIAQSYLLE